MSAIENARAALATLEAHPFIDDTTCAWIKLNTWEARQMRAALRDLLAHVEATTPTDDEREAITAAIDAILNPFGQGTATQERLVLAAAEKWANRQVPLDEDTEFVCGNCGCGIPDDFRRQETRPITDVLSLIESREYYEAKPHKAHADLEAVRAALEAAEAAR